MPAVQPNPIRYLVEQKRQEIRTAEDRLAGARADQAWLQQNNNGLSNWPGFLDRFGSISPNVAMSQVASTIAQLQGLLPKLNKDLAELELKANELDERAGQAIENGSDPNAAYSAELAKMQTRATLLAVLKWAAIIGAALLVLYMGRRLFMRIANR